jgi:hypothetical protein
MNPISPSTDNDPEYEKGCRELAQALGEVLKTHLEQKPYSRTKVYQALNALAIHAAVMLVGCDDEGAIEFFQDCVELSYDDFQEHQAQKRGDFLS